MKTILKIVICKRIYGVVLLIISSTICFYCNSLWGKEIREILNYPIHGICHSPFRDGESPNLGIFPGIDAIKEDLSILSKMTLNIRTYGTDGVLYEIPRLCNEFHINCYVGGWISGDESFKGQIKKIRMPNKLEIKYNYAPDNRLSAVNVGQFYQLEYSYDKGGRLAEMRQVPVNP